jgi:hypothetical protein
LVPIEALMPAISQAISQAMLINVDRAKCENACSYDDSRPALKRWRADVREMADSLQG